MQYRADDAKIIFYTENNSAIIREEKVNGSIEEFSIKVDGQTPAILNPDLRFLPIAVSVNEFVIVERNESGFEVVENVTHGLGVPYFIDVTNEEPFSYLYAG